MKAIQNHNKSNKIIKQNIHYLHQIVSDSEVFWKAEVPVPPPPHWYLWARAVQRLCPGCQPRALSSGGAGMWGLLADVGWALLCMVHSGCRSLPLREVLLAGFCLEPRTPGRRDRNQAISCLFSLAVVESIWTSDNDSNFTFDPFIWLWRNNSKSIFSSVI